MILNKISKKKIIKGKILNFYQSIMIQSQINNFTNTLIYTNLRDVKGLVEK